VKHRGGALGAPLSGVRRSVGDYVNLKTMHDFNHRYPITSLRAWKEDLNPLGALTLSSNVPSAILVRQIGGEPKTALRVDVVALSLVESALPYQN
jgi:hypothetical protein